LRVDQGRRLCGRRVFQQKRLDLVDAHAGKTRRAYRLIAATDDTMTCRNLELALSTQHRTEALLVIRHLFVEGCEGIMILAGKIDGTKTSLLRAAARRGTLALRLVAAA
jgi:hypothetical protein